MEQSLLDDVAGCFKLLAIFTSALFAIAQYYENRQRKTIEHDQRIIMEIDLSQQDNPSALKDSVKSIYDKIMNVKPINNQKIIFCLLLLICFLIFLFVLSLWLDWVPVVISIIRGTLRIYSAIMLFFAGWLLLNWMLMQSQMKNFQNSIDNFKTLSDTFKKFLEQTNRK